MVQAVDVAAALHELATKENRQITQLQLLKLVYLSLGWHFALRDSALFAEDVQAWTYGPVVQSVYNQTRAFGSAPIPSGRIRGRADKIPDKSMQVIKQVWNAYKNYSGPELTALTHKRGTPWHNVLEQNGGRLPPFAVIPKAEIERHFKNEAGRAA